MYIRPPFHIIGSYDLSGVEDTLLYGKDTKSQLKPSRGNNLQGMKARVDILVL